MRVYTVRYKTNNYSDKVYEVNVAAVSVVRAAQAIGKHKYTGYSGHVVSVVEALSSVVIAK